MPFDVICMEFEKIRPIGLKTSQYILYAIDAR